MATEERRACGYRKAGGLYLVGSGRSVACDRLPLPLEACPACGRVAEQNRSHEWLGPEYFTDHAPSRRTVPENRIRGGRRRLGAPVPCPDRQAAEALRERLGAHPGRQDPICERGTDRRLLLWVGRAFYSPASFSAEAAQMGVSRRLTQIPKGLELGRTWVLLAHPDACSEPTSWGFRWLFGEGEVVPAPGVFYAFRPERLELVLKQSDATPERIAKEAERGVTVVAVPDEDRDHQGSVWDKKTDLEDAAPLAPEDLPSPEPGSSRETPPPLPIGPLERYDHTEGP